jgi:cytidylate kinase
MNNILISGLTGVGKTSFSRYLCQRLGYGYISGSDVRGRFHKLYRGKEFWLKSKEHILIDYERISNVMLEDPIDKELEFLNSTKHKNVFDVWFLPWYTQVSSFKVLLTASLETRVKRIANNKLSSPDLQNLVHQKDLRSYEYALKKFNIDILNDISPFDLIINNEGYSEDIFFLKSYEDIIYELI